jgi:hypothetical protein
LESRTLLSVVPTPFTAAPQDLTVANLPAAAQQVITAAIKQEAKLTASDGEFGDAFGAAVAISGNTVVVGAPASIGTNVYEGAVYVFTKPGSGWANMTQVAKLTPSNAQWSDTFGLSVAISGNTVVVGA